MAKTLRQILGAKNLVGVIQRVKGGVPADILPPSFMRTTRRVEGNSATYRKVTTTRKTARLVQYGAPSKTRDLAGVEEVPVTLLSTAEHIHHKPQTLLNLQNIGDESKQRLGEAEIARQTGEFKRLFTNLRVSSIYSALASGYLYFDGDGNLLPSSSGAVITVDFGVPAGNRSQLDVFGAGDILDASWATAGTLIHKQIAALKKAARKLTGYPITTAFYGEDTLDYFLKNTYLKEIINRAAPYQTAFAGGEIPNGFLGLNWVPLYEAFYADNDGSYQDFLASDTVIFTPDASPDWWEMIEGSTVIPTDLGRVAADGQAALRQVMLASGQYSYGVLTDDPVTVKHIAGDVFLPLLKVPKAIFIADTVWT